jgi:hypothetical protein
MSEVRQYTDLRLKDRRWIIRRIIHEHAHQIAKWGVQTHTAFEWLTYTAEELGSLAKAIGEHEYRGGPKDRVISEAIQVATLALKIAEMFENTREER